MVSDLELWCFGKLKDKDIFHYINKGFKLALLPYIIRYAMFKSEETAIKAIQEIALHSLDPHGLLTIEIRKAITLRDIMLAAPFYSI